jgi:uncharacterized protein YneR
MATTRLKIYNDALILMGERALANLTEEREPRRLLDQVWTNDGIEQCLEEAQWYFAMRGVQIDYDPAVSTEFGYSKAFSKPDDWVLTSALCVDEHFQVPLTLYSDESGYWYSDETVIYVKYVSDDAAYGKNLAIWPRSFTEFVAAHFAFKIAFKIGGEKLFQKMLAIRDEFLTRAKNRAAMALPTQFPAQGSWNRSRHRYLGNRDSGSRNNLIG